MADDFSVNGIQQPIERIDDGAAIRVAFRTDQGLVTLEFPESVARGLAAHIARLFPNK